MTSKTQQIAMFTIIAFAIGGMMVVPTLLDQKAEAICANPWTQSFSFTMSGYEGSATGSKTVAQVVCGETFTVTTVADQANETVTTTWTGPATLNGDAFTRIITELSGGWNNMISESDYDSDYAAPGNSNTERVRDDYMGPGETIYVDHEWVY